MLKELNIEQFAAKAADRTPVPGGGNVGACVAAFGAALGAMAARFTTGEKFASMADKIRPIVEEYDRLRARFLELMERDAEAYGKYAEASKLPKDTPEQKERRRKAMAEASAASLAVPVEVMAECLRGLQITRELVPVCNPRLLGDAAAAAYFMEAASRVAMLNAFENAGGIADEAGRDRARAEALERAAACAGLRDEIDRSIRGLMRIPAGS
ncbi:MAG: cyclodeaminase/cyclohydrolase family protein [Planctomycetota bacterium]|nr:cyclodeaminase/cyclohydrolase family protein [Planctomycetota bacterium]